MTERLSDKSLAALREDIAAQATEYADMLANGEKYDDGGLDVMDESIKYQQLADALDELDEYRRGSRDDLTSKIEAIQQAHDEIAELVDYRKSGDGTVQVTWPSMSERLDGITGLVIELRSYAVVPYSRSMMWSSPDQALTDLRKWREEVSGDDD